MSSRMQNDVHYLSSLFFLNFSFGSLWNLLRFPFSCWVIVNIWWLWIIVFGHYLLFLLLQYIYVGLGLIRVYKVFFRVFDSVDLVVSVVCLALDSTEKNQGWQYIWCTPILFLRERRMNSTQLNHNHNKYIIVLDVGGRSSSLH